MWPTLRSVVELKDSSCAFYLNAVQVFCFCFCFGGASVVLVLLCLIIWITWASVVIFREVFLKSFHFILLINFYSTLGQ